MPGRAFRTGTSTGGSADGPPDASDVLGRLRTGLRPGEYDLAGTTLDEELEEVVDRRLGLDLAARLVDGGLDVVAGDGSCEALGEIVDGPRVVGLVVLRLVRPLGMGCGHRLTS